MAERYYPENVMFQANPGTVQAGMSKARSEDSKFAAMWRENSNGQLASNIVATETQAADDLRALNNAKATAATAPMPEGFTTKTIGG